jgi:pimeloyl-ACP methyl ester carboxylesterase
MAWYAQRFRTLSWDQRGLGRSGPAPRYSLPLYAADLAALLDHLAIDRAVTFGVSWGVYVALRFALDFPARCLALVLDSGSSEVNAAAAENCLQGELARRGPAALAGLDLAPAFAGHRTAAQSGAWREVRPEHLDSFVAQARAIAGTREHPLTPYLARITCPALVVGGGRDEVSGAGGSVVLGRALPHARTEILPEAGHGVYMTAREPFRALLLEFLAAHRLHPVA